MKKPASGSTGKKKKKKKKERGSERSCEQTNELRIKLYLKNLGGALHENGMKRRRYTHSHHALQRMPLICFHRCAVQFGCGLKWWVIDHRKTSEEDQIKFVDQWTKCCQHHGQYPWCIRAKMHSQLTRIAFSALPNIAYSFETVHEIASARRSPLSKKGKKSARNYFASNHNHSNARGICARKYCNRCKYKLVKIIVLVLWSILNNYSPQCC